MGQFNKGRLSNDIALLYTDRDIDLNNPYVNTACLPSCDNQFDYIFSNGTGVRCWVAGWGKNEVDGTFQFIQKKVALPLVPASRCNNALKTALNNQRQGTGNRFQLHSSEVCAGGEVGKDACTGDGGSPLVCQAQSGRWTVVGLVTWAWDVGLTPPESTPRCPTSETGSMPTKYVIQYSNQYLRLIYSFYIRNIDHEIH